MIMVTTDTIPNFKITEVIGFPPLSDYYKFLLVGYIFSLKGWSRTKRRIILSLVINSYSSLLFIS